MRILDRYIIKKFLTILFYTTMAFIVIFIVVDLIERLDKFLGYGAGSKVLFLYYIFYIPFIIILTLPINMLLSTLFSIGSMAQHNEIIASQSAGVSLYRIIFPVLVLGFIISILCGLTGEWVVPHTNRERLDIYRYEIRKEQRRIISNRQRIAMQDGEGRQIYIGFYDGDKKQARQINVIWVEKNGIVKRMDAKSMVWSDEKNGWKLSNITLRNFSDSSEVVTRLDSLWYTDTQIHPEDLMEMQLKPEEMNYSELNRFIDRMFDLGADVRKWLVDLYMKIAYPFSNFIIVLFGAPLAARKRRSGPAVGFAIALLISFIFFLFLRTGQVLGHKGDMAPWVAAWSGNIVFGIGGIIALIRARK
ncbi:MAG: LptF/LptG family permease [Calditrichia bacterium]